MRLTRGTEFQRKVWREVAKIPRGKTRTYKEIAEDIGNPLAYRAVGQACKKNPVPGIIPCHRVIRSDGGLGGYSRGIRKKKYLLRKECRYKTSARKSGCRNPSVMGYAI